LQQSWENRIEGGSEVIDEQRLIQSFFEMVQIPSESGEEAEFINYLKDRFQTELKATCTIDSYGNLIAKIPGKSCSDCPTILFGAHADTVKPGKGIQPILENGIIRSQGDTILGGDDKAGIAELLKAILTAEVHPPLEIVVTREEEIGLVGARHVDVTQLQARKGFLLDSSNLDEVVIGGPSYMNIDIEITGKAAHAGMEPEKGISAIKVASYAIAMLRDGRIDPETTSNIGVIRGGEIRNGVPEKVTIMAECRSLNHEKCLKESQKIKEIFEAVGKISGAKVNVKLDLETKASMIPSDAEVVRIAKKAIESVNLTPKVFPIVGGTDASIYNEKGIETVVLGVGVQAEHSKEEYIPVEEMKKAVLILHAIFKECCSSSGRRG
jgi:tripeptide aminopeptidase